MKRLVVLTLVLFLALSTLCLAEEPSFSTFDYVTGSAGGGRFIYYDFPDISLCLPESWKDLYTVEKRTDSISFYQMHEHYFDRTRKNKGSGPMLRWKFYGL